MAGNAKDWEAYGPEYANYMIDLQVHLSGLGAQIGGNEHGANELKLGHASTGDVATTCIAHAIFTITKAMFWLRDRGCRHFPDSRSASKYRNQAERPGAINRPDTKWARSFGCTLPIEQLDPRCPVDGFI